MVHVMSGTPALTPGGTWRNGAVKTGFALSSGSLAIGCAFFAFLRHWDQVYLGDASGVAQPSLTALKIWLDLYYVALALPIGGIISGVVGRGQGRVRVMCFSVFVLVVQVVVLFLSMNSFH
jgi:hypothetical protein